MATEATPLLPEVTLPTKIMPDPEKHDPEVTFASKMPTHVINNHWVGISLALISAWCCWASGMAGYEIVDPMVTKSVLIFFCFAMGFRNTLANQRRVEAMDKVHRLTSSFWGIYATLPPELREKFREPLVDAIGKLVDHLCDHSQTMNYWYGVMNLLHLTTKTKQEELHSTVTFSPRALLVNTLLALETELVALEGRPNLKLVRNLWLHKALMLESYDVLFSCTLPAVSPNYRIFTDFSLTVFAIALPWSIGFGALGHHEDKFHLAIILLETFFVCMVMYIFETLTRINEDPLAPDKEEENLCLQNLRSITTIVVSAYDVRCGVIEKLSPDPVKSMHDFRSFKSHSKVWEFDSPSPDPDKDPDATARAREAAGFMMP